MSEGAIICEREFSTVFDGVEHPFVVQWMRPAPDQNDWRCEFVIHWPTGPAVRSYAMGVDSTQALVLALHNAQTRLETSPWSVRWFDHPPGELGLPSFHARPEPSEV